MEKAKLEEFERALRDRVKGDISFDEITRGIYATDASIYQIMPVAVVLPRDEADVRAAVQTAAEYNVTILPRGGGTSLGGQAVGRSMILDFSKYMNKVLEVNVEDRWVRVQPGDIWTNSTPSWPSTACTSLPIRPPAAGLRSAA